MNKITTINGIPMVMQDDFFRHTEDTTIHVTAEEKEKWNAGGQGSKGERETKAILVSLPPWILQTSDMAWSKETIHGMVHKRFLAVSR